MRNSTNITMGVIILVSGFGMFGIITFAMDHGFLMDYGYLIHYPSQKTASFDYTQSMTSRFTNEMTQWGVFGYLRVGFAIIGFSGMVYLIINGVTVFLKRKE